MSIGDLEHDANDVVFEQTEEKKDSKLEQDEKKTEFVRELFFLIILGAASIALLIPSIQMWMNKPNANAPGMFPTIVTFGMLLCDGIALVQLLGKKTAEGSDMDEIGWEKLKFIIGTEVPFTVFVMMAATLLYVASLKIIGFYIATFIYLTFAIVFLYKGDRSKIVQALLVAAGMDLVVYIVIDLIFQIHMP